MGRVTCPAGDPEARDVRASAHAVLVHEHCTLTVEAGQLVYDPFLGSGTTLIAAEQLGRKCYGLEISPAYCDVIVNRWENLTGRKAERNGARTDPETNEAENTIRRKERGPDKPKRTRSTKRQTAGT